MPKERQLFFVFSDTQVPFQLKGRTPNSAYFQHLRAYGHLPAALRTYARVGVFFAFAGLRASSPLQAA